MKIWMMKREMQPLAELGQKKERTFLIPLNSVKVLERRRSSIERFLTNYAIGLIKVLMKKIIKLVWLTWQCS